MGGWGKEDKKEAFKATTFSGTREFAWENNNEKLVLPKIIEMRSQCKVLLGTSPRAPD